MTSFFSIISKTFWSMTEKKQIEAYILWETVRKDPLLSEAFEFRCGVVLISVGTRLLERNAYRLFRSLWKHRCGLNWDCCKFQRNVHQIDEDKIRFRTIWYKVLNRLDQDVFIEENKVKAYRCVLCKTCKLSLFRCQESSYNPPYTWLQTRSHRQV